MKSSSRKSSYLIKKSNTGTDGLHCKNMAVLTKYHQEYCVPFYNKDSESIQRKIQSNQYSALIREFKPFLSKKGVKTINEIALLSLAGMERGMNIEVENKSLKSYIKMLEEEKKPAIYGDIKTSIDVNVSFAIEYLYYIQKYGVPQDGIFDPVKLAEFM